MKTIVNKKHNNYKKINYFDIKILKKIKKTVKYANKFIKPN
jgi:hypothetical protein